MEQRKQTNRFITPPVFEDSKNPNFMYVYATGVFGGLDPNGGRMTFFLDRIEPETLNQPTPGAQTVKKIMRESQVEVHMSPAQFKSIALWMQAHIQRYEESFGPIVVGPKQQQKQSPSSSSKMIS